MMIEKEIKSDIQAWFHLQRAFTLIELAIVLVVIGLIVGGVLVGRDLVRAGEVRATLTQVEKYNTAVNTFRGKYNALPGDLNVEVASRFNFTARGNYAGQGDGNGVIEGVRQNAANSNHGFRENGELLMFWVDLSVANGLRVNLIEESFSTATPTALTPITAATMPQYFPGAKFGNGNYVYVYSTRGVNYFGITKLSSVGQAGAPTSVANIPVKQAYQIDKKIDDGIPGIGGTTSQYITGDVLPNATAPWVGATINASGTITAATPASATTCYDNGNVAGAQAVYSITRSNGAGANCAVSFRFQ